MSPKKLKRVTARKSHSPVEALTTFAAECLRNEFTRLGAFDAARRSLQEQSRRCGGDGSLRDVQAFLCEDGRTVMLFADYASDDHLSTSFLLSKVTREADFDSQFYVRECERG